jgi:GNAT superfamily N-acetyltransferase
MPRGPRRGLSRALRIRPATRRDLPGLLGLYAQPDLDDGRMLPVPRARRLWERIARYPAYGLFVATRGRELVGAFSLLIMDNLAHGGAPSAIVEDVVVDPRRHGRGIGTRMMRFAMARSRRAGCYKLVLSSAAKRRRAHRFYRKLGFRRHGYSFVVGLRGTGGMPSRRS